VSFILDALRKSEHARQHLGGATLAELPMGRRQRSQPWWVMALAVLLLVNLVILTLVLLRKSPEPALNPPQPQTQAVPASPSVASNATRVAAPVALAEEAAQPPAVEYETIPREDSPLAADVPDGPTLVRPIERAAAAPVFTANGLPDLHIDMHVYAKSPKDRFVLINMRKYVEGQTITEGPQIDEITAEGVNLFYKGQALSLPRP
jgi:general secretion pathway protein B